jgi:ribosomal protein L29
METLLDRIATGYVAPKTLRAMAREEIMTLAQELKDRGQTYNHLDLAIELTKLRVNKATKSVLQQVRQLVYSRYIRSED